MNLGDLQQRLKKLLMDRCGVNEEAIRPEATLNTDLGLDSLDAVELAIAIEDEFDVKIADEDMKKLATVGDALATIQRLLTDKPTGGGGPSPALHPAGS
jgi:acyl carrier protein